MHVPEGWKVRTGNLTDGISEADFRAAAGGNNKKDVRNRRKKEGRGENAAGTVTNAILDAFAMDGFADGTDVEGMLNGTLIFFFRSQFSEICFEFTIFIMCSFLFIDSFIRYICLYVLY